eukprot:gene11161-7939_t
MSSSRRSSTNPLPANGGYMAMNANSEFTKLISASQAQFIFDTTVLPIDVQTHAVKWATHLAEAISQSLPEDSYLPEVFMGIDHEGSLRDAIKAHQTGRIASRLKATVFTHADVKAAASAPSKLLAAFCIASGQGTKASMPFKTACGIAAKLIGAEAFDLRQFAATINQSEEETNAIEAVYGTHTESKVLQAVLLLSLLHFCSTPRKPSAPPLSPATLERLQTILTPPPASSQRKKAATAPPRTRTEPPGAPSTSTAELLAKIRRLEEQLEATAPSQSTAIRSPTRVADKNSKGTRSPAPSSKRKPTNAIELMTSDSSSSEEHSDDYPDDDDDDDNHNAENGQTFPHDTATTPNHRARTRAQRLFSAPSRPGEDNDAAHKRAVDIWHRSYTTWAADARKRGISDTSHKAYEKESPYPKAPTPKRPARLDRRALASQQHRIAPIATFCDLVD